MYLHDGENDDSGGEEREDSVVWDETDRSDPVEPVLLETVLEAETHTHAAQNKRDTQKNPAINIDWWQTQKRQISSCQNRDQRIV